MSNNSPQMLWRYGAKFIDKALIGTEIQAMFIIDKAHELMRIVANKMNNENNFNLKFSKHKIPSSTMVSVVDFETEYLGSNSNFLNDGLTDNRATYVTADLRILLMYY